MSDLRAAAEALTARLVLGDWDGTLDLLEQLERDHGRAGSYGGLLALAAAALHGQEPGVWSVETDHDIETVPAGIRCAVRFLAASANDDKDTTWALFLASGRLSAEDRGQFLAVLLQAASSGLRRAATP